MFFRRLSASFTGRLLWVSVPVGSWFIFALWHCIINLLGSDFGTLRVSRVCLYRGPIFFCGAWDAASALAALVPSDLDLQARWIPLHVCSLFFIFSIRFGGSHLWYRPIHCARHGDGYTGFHGHWPPFFRPGQLRWVEVDSILRISSSSFFSLHSPFDSLGKPVHESPPRNSLMSIYIYHLSSAP